MSENKYRDLAEKILPLVGGKGNVNSVANCMTRLRLGLNDTAKADIAAIKALDGVMGVQEDATLQVIVGPGKAKKLADEFKVVSGVGGSGGATETNWQDNKSAIKSLQKQSGFKVALRTISDIFVPLLPAIIAAGLFNGIAGIIGQTAAGQAQLAAESGGLYLAWQFLAMLGSALLGYFAIYTGINSAKVFGATPALGGMVGAIVMSGSINIISAQIEAFTSWLPIDFTTILSTNKGGIIGVVIGVWLLSKIERFFHRIVPEVVDLIVTPLLTIFIVAVALVFVIMPFAGLVSDGLMFVLNLLINSANPVVNVIAGYVLAAVFLPMVLFGLHHGLTAIYSLQLEQTGSISLFPVLAMAGAGQVGAAFAIFFKARKINKKLSEIAIGAIPAGILGIGEPLIYGVTLPLGKPFITAGLGAGFGGAFIRLMNVQASGFGASGMVAIPLMTTLSGMLNFFLALLISYVMGFLITWLLIKEKDLAPA